MRGGVSTLFSREGRLLPSAGRNSPLAPQGRLRTCHRRVRKKLATFSLLFAWLCANGALLDGVQVFAWAKMFASYARVMPIGEALRTTFDPNRPCDMCLGIAAAKETARQQLPAGVERASEKIQLALHTPAALVLLSPPAEWPPVRTGAAPARTEPVPVPPPRA